MQTVNAEVVLKATNVDGVYDADPRHNPNARLIETVSYHEVTSRDLSVMDMTALHYARKTTFPLLCLTCKRLETLQRQLLVCGKKVGTFIGCTRTKSGTKWKHSVEKEDWLTRCELNSFTSCGLPPLFLFSLRVGGSRG